MWISCSNFLKNVVYEPSSEAQDFEPLPFYYWKHLEGLFTKYHFKVIGNLLLNLLAAVLSISEGSHKEINLSFVTLEYG